MDDFLFLADSYHNALLLRQRAEALLNSLGLQRNPKKGIWTPTQVDDHLGLTVDLQLGMFRAPPAKLHQLAPAGGAAAAAPERGALAGPSARTSTSTRWALVTP
jgi:hypothetical protein